MEEDIIMVNSKNQDREKKIFQEEDNNVNLEVINEKLSSNFQKQLSDVKVVEKYFKNTSKEVKPLLPWFSSPYNEIYYHVNFNFDKLFKYEYKRNGLYSVDARINVHELSKFLTDVENEVKEKSEEVFNQQLISNENKYFALFNSIKEEYNYREESLKRELQIVKDDSSEVIQKYNLLIQQSSAYIEKREEIIRQNNEIKCWEAKYYSVFSSLEIVNVDLMIATVEISSLNNILKNRISRLEEYRISFYEERQRLINEFCISCNLRDEIKMVKSDLGEEIRLLTNSSNNWKKKYEESSLTLNFKDDQLKELQRVHFWMKLKLSTVLALDSARAIMPNWCNNTLTVIETGILAGQLFNSKIEKTFWISASVYFFLSIIFTTYKLTKFSILTFIKLWKKFDSWLNNDLDSSFDFENFD